MAPRLGPGSMPWEDKRSAESRWKQEEEYGRKLKFGEVVSETIPCELCGQTPTINCFSCLKWVCFKCYPEGGRHPACGWAC